MNAFKLKIFYYLNTTKRSFLKNKTFSIINLFGLVVGMTCFLMIYIWMDYEMSFDKFHKNAEYLYRVNNQWPGSDYSLNCPGPIARVLKEDFPEIINSSLYCKINRMKISHHNKHFFSTYTFIDPSFFDMFDFPLYLGDAKHVFDDPYSIVLSKELSEKVFGDIDPIGEIIILNDGQFKLKVTGVLKEIPKNSHIQIDCLVFSEIGIESLKTWKNNWPNAYVQLDKNSDYKTVSDKISGTVIKYVPENINTLSLEPFSRIHLYDRNGGGLIIYITVFSAIALMILLIACFNFINLSTAQGIIRFKELAIRKILGATQLRLILQFFNRSNLILFDISLFFIKSNADIINYSFSAR